MRVLLDTHVVLWLASAPERVPSSVKASLEDADERIVSSVTAYEIAQKTRLGKLQGGDLVLGAWQRLMVDQRSVELSLTVAHMTRAGSLAWEHRDPFDRMLVAQAQVEGLALATSDRRLIDFAGAPTIRWS